MKIPKFLHPILGVMAGTILFLVGIALLSAIFVATYRLVLYARPYVTEVLSYIAHYLSQWLPL